MCPHCACALICMAIDTMAAIDWKAWFPVICRERTS